jgi:hypothetical protein
VRDFPYPDREPVARSINTLNPAPGLLVVSLSMIQKALAVLYTAVLAVLPTPKVEKEK